jgi:2-iminobutanoate/2-iminopropanoate deaminase
LAIPRYACKALTALCAAFTLVACSNAPTLGGRPLIYPNRPGDAVEEKAGIVRKVEPAQPEQARAPAPAPAPAYTPPRRAEPAQPAPQPPVAVAQAAPASSARASADDGSSRYTQATRYGDLLFVSGQIAIDLRSGAFDSQQGIEAQTRAVLENVRAILESHRLTMANIVSTTVYLSNISNLSKMDGVYRDFFKGTPPARSVVEVSNLPRGALVEISVIAGR